MNKYRFDDAYSKVYEYDEECNAYIFVGSYIAYGINAKMSEEEKTHIVENQEIE